MAEDSAREEALEFRGFCEQAANRVLSFLETRQPSVAPGASDDRGRAADQSLSRLRKKCRALPAAFIGRDTGLSAGCVPRPSLSYVLPFGTSAALGRRYRCGTPPEALSDSAVSFLQIILADPGERGTTLNTLLARRSLTGILPGYMAKSLGLSTSVKVHRALLQHGFTGAVLEAMIREAYAPLAEEGITVITGFDCDPEIEALTSIIQPVDQALGALFQKRVSRGYAECGLDRDCGSCAENIVCGNILRFSRERENRGRNI